jgi:hypothetical protein
MARAITFYNMITGEIVQNSSVKKDSLIPYYLEELGPDHNWIEGQYSGLEYTVDLDTMQPIKRAERLEKPRDETYVGKRAREYPPIEDQLDAIFQGGQAFAEMKVAIQMVKDKYPKP